MLWLVLLLFLMSISGLPTLCMRILYWVRLKTHFGLHSTLMTLSSLEIRICWCLMPLLQVGACNGVIALDIRKLK